jgi:dihydrolipoamide dehydrogenase
VIVATGASPIAIGGLEVDECLVWSHVGALQPDRVPGSLLVIGAGAIGIEFACFYAALGAEVTVLELQPQILSAVDDEIAAHARCGLEKQGVRILTGARVTAAEKQLDTVTVTWEQDGGVASMTVERVICAVGMKANTEGLGLERRGVATHRSGIQVDGFGRTSVTGIHAVGDVAGAPMLAHKAEHEGIICAERIAGLDPHPLERGMIPSCIYSTPQIASVGLSERHAKQQGWDIHVGRFPLSANGKALAMGEQDGLVKTVFDRVTGRLLGAHLVGAEVTELIHGYVVAMNLETTEEDLMHVIYPHPTLSETMHESTLAAYGRAIHLPPPATRSAALSAHSIKSDHHEYPPEVAEASR